MFSLSLPLYHYSIYWMYLDQSVNFLHKRRVSLHQLSPPTAQRVLKGGTENLGHTDTFQRALSVPEVRLRCKLTLRLVWRRHSRRCPKHTPKTLVTTCLSNMLNEGLRGPYTTGLLVSKGFKTNSTKTTESKAEFSIYVVQLQTG